MGQPGGRTRRRERQLNCIAMRSESYLAVLLSLCCEAVRTVNGRNELECELPELAGPLMVPDRDVHQGNVNGPVYDLATTLSKFLHLGVSLEEVIRRVTVNPAKALAFPSGTGSLAPGSLLPPLQGDLVTV